jgi:2-polyprenyl-6-methoxyphenol hydroxylase-like FAD-dependent oxidoreductase
MRRVIVIGGSLGGLFAGCNLRRAGWDVTILERTPERLEGRGAGLGVHPSMIQGLLAAGAKVDASVGVPVAFRTAFDPRGDVIGEISMPQFCTSWARLHSMLSAVFPEKNIRRGVSVTALGGRPGAVFVQLADGSRMEGDLIVAADGVRSTARKQIFPDVEMSYAGYIAWRGMVEETALSAKARATIFGRFGWALLKGEHILGYPVPGAGDDVTPGRRRYSFAWYRPTSARALAEMQTDAEGRNYPEGIPPHLVRPEVIAAFREEAEVLLPPVWAEVVRESSALLFQPIGDVESPAMAHGGVAFVGDSAFLARPHVARGAIKAGHDAMTLADALQRHDLEEGLATYDRIRGAASRAVVAESRRLGAYLEGGVERDADPIAFLRENGGVDASDTSDGGLFFRLLADTRLAAQVDRTPGRRNQSAATRTRGESPNERKI